MKISIILPVKTYSKAKTRLELPAAKRENLCHIMLQEMLHVLKSSKHVQDIVVVTAEEKAQSLCNEMGATVIRDQERGVNQAVSLADGYLASRGDAMSLVLPQDIPLLEPDDVSFLLKFFTPPTCVIVVPSARFDGTNALVRCPPDIMKTHYDDNSYRNHMRMARESTPNHALVYAPNIMRDIDTVSDLHSMLNTTAKPNFVNRVREMLG